MLFSKNKNLLIGSVFGNTERNESFYKLQLEYLNKTTKNFDHVVTLDKANEKIFNYSKIIGHVNQKLATPSERHCDGLNKIVQHAINEKYENLLILDSDAFPIKENWMNILESKMQSFLTASVVRPENLDVFAHPCICFVKCRIFKEIKFEYSKSINLLGYSFEDSMSNQKDFYPLVRTNYINLHPILYGIYNDMFYHHGAGSRKIFIRAIDICNYYETPEMNEEENYTKLTNETHNFINFLRGKNDSIGKI